MLDTEGIALEMTRGVLQSAKDAGAQCIVVACPMCHMALESLYAKVESKANVKLDIPVLYITQLMGLAFGFGVRELGLQRNLISPMGVVHSLK